MKDSGHAVGCADAGSIDARASFDAGNCIAAPTLDGTSCTGTHPPHAYRCILSTLPEPCIEISEGNVTNIFCCP